MRTTVAERRVKRKRVVLTVLSLRLFILVLEVTVVIGAVPQIMSACGVGMGFVEWVCNVCALLSAALLLGTMGDLFGWRKCLLLLGVGAFTLVSLGCSVAPSGALHPDWQALLRQIHRTSINLQRCVRSGRAISSKLFDHTVRQASACAIIPGIPNFNYAYGG